MQKFSQAFDQSSSRIGTKWVQIGLQTHSAWGGGKSASSPGRGFLGGKDHWLRGLVGLEISLSMANRRMSVSAGTQTVVFKLPASHYADWAILSLPATSKTGVEYLTGTWSCRRLARSEYIENICHWDNHSVWTSNKLHGIMEWKNKIYSHPKSRLFQLPTRNK